MFTLLVSHTRLAGAPLQCWGAALQCCGQSRITHLAGSERVPLGAPLCVTVWGRPCCGLILPLTCVAGRR